MITTLHKYRAMACVMLGLLAFAQAPMAASTRVDGEVYLNGTPLGVYEKVELAAVPMVYGSHTVTSADYRTWGLANPGDIYRFAKLDPDTQTLRSASAASAYGNGLQTSVSTRGLIEGKEFTVGAGTSKLGIGDTVTLKIELHLDGVMALGKTAFVVETGHPPAWGYGALTMMTMNYAVFEVGNDTPLVRLAYNADASYGYSTDGTPNDILTDTFRAWGYYDVGDSRTSLPTIFEDHTQSPVIAHDWPFAAQQRIHLVDPGVLTFFVDTHVGSTLLFDGFINTEAVAIGDSRMTALSDFGSTFDAEMTPDVAGVELIGLQAGVAPIPEAGTFALMLAGLGVLSAALRRRAGRS